MLDDLLARARKQADRSSPVVRAAARMRIARVESAVDPGQARITFGMALDEIRSFPGRERDFFFEHAQQIAAAFAPDLLRDIPSVHCLPDDFHGEQLVSIMLQHGHIDAAFDFVKKRASQTRESFSAAAGSLIAPRTWLDSISPHVAESRTHSHSPTQSGL